MEIGVSTASLFKRQYNEDALITLNEIEAVKIKVDKLPNNIASKKSMQKQVAELEIYATLKEEIDSN